MINRIHTASRWPGRLFLALLLGCLSNVQAQKLQVTTSVDRNPVGLTTQFTLRIDISGTTQDLPTPELPELKDFRLLGGPNTSTSFRIVNGAMSTNKSYTFILLPRGKGTFVIPAVEVEYKGESYSSAPINLVVGDEVGGGPDEATGDRRPPQTNQDAGRVFLSAIPSKRSAYENEQITISYKLYFNQAVRNPDFVELPEAVGFWVEDFDMPKEVAVTQETLDGVQYNVAELKRMAVFPTRAGQLTISPMELSVDVITRRQRRRDPFDIMDGFFGNSMGQTERKSIRSRHVTIDVKPLPAAGKPAGFSGLVGSFRLQSELDKEQVKANEAISLKLKFSGSGNLKSMGELPLGFPPGFEVYDPKLKEVANRSGRRFTASRELEYVLIPRSGGEYRIAPLEVSYFDPEMASYNTLRTPEYLVRVEQNEAASGIASVYVPKSEVRLLGRDIHFIKEAALRVVPLGHRPYKSGWFVSALLLPLLMLGGVVVYHQHTRKMTSNIGYARNRRALKQAGTRLKEARRLLDEGKAAEFYGETAQSIIGFLADKSNRPAAGLLQDDVERLLREHKVEEELCRTALDMLNEADFRRFAPDGAKTSDEAESFYRKAEELLEKLGKFF